MHLLAVQPCPGFKRSNDCKEESSLANMANEGGDETEAAEDENKDHHHHVTKVQFATQISLEDHENHNDGWKNHRNRTLSESSYFSGASSIMSSSSLSSLATNPLHSANLSYASRYQAPDGGWGWVVVIASFLVNMIADGVTFSFGVLFDELEKEFGESKAVTAGVVSLFHAVPLLSGPVASALTDR